MTRHESKPMGISEAAAASGLAASTIRYYEDQGVLPAAERAANGYRVYDQAALARLRFVRNARLLDFSLAEVRQVLALREQGEAPCGRVLALLDAKLEEAAARIRALQVWQGELHALRRAAQGLPTDDVAMEACVCHLIRTRSTTNTPAPEEV